jgi:hypothetical protein
MTNEEAAITLEVTAVADPCLREAVKLAIAALRRPCPEAGAGREALVEVAKRSLAYFAVDVDKESRVVQNVAELIVTEYLSTRAASHPATTEGA